jgi:putative phosphoribosyl transferase
MATFVDREDAGRQLAARLGALRDQDVVVLGIPRGGVPVAYQVARALGAPLDVIVVRKLGLPGHEELAMGAIGEGGYRVLDRDLIRRARVTGEQVQGVERREQAELRARLARFRRGRGPADLTGRVALVVDDGIATGATASVACEVARHLGAEKVVLAVPVGPADTLERLQGPDEVVAVATPYPFNAVGQHYRDFTPTSDDEVVALLEAATWVDRGVEEAVVIPAGGVDLPADLSLPAGATGVVVFAHGSGSSRLSPRNRYVASVLHRAGLGTLLMDLLTPAEEQDRTNVFDIRLLADRLGAATRWLRADPRTAGLPVGYFGASTGAGAALWAASDPELGIAAVVSRGGRPDLAGPRLPRVTAPTLLVIGSGDPEVLRLNQLAQSRLSGPSRLAIVAGANHLFEEPGTLTEAAGLARDWFHHYLVRVRPDLHHPRAAG